MGPVYDALCLFSSFRMVHGGFYKWLIKRVLINFAGNVPTFVSMSTEEGKPLASSAIGSYLALRNSTPSSSLLILIV